MGGHIPSHQGTPAAAWLPVAPASPCPENVNHPEPGKIPILNNSPTMIFRDGRFVPAFGTPGGLAIGQA